MKSRLSPLALIMALLLAFGAIAVACDGDSGGSSANSSGGPLTLEEYFQRLQALGDAADEREIPIEEEFWEQLAAADSEEEAIEAYKVFSAAILPMAEEHNDGLENLNPPPEVERVHNRMVEGIIDVRSVLRELINELDEVESTLEAEELVETLGSDPAFERFSGACREFQEIANEAGIDVDLGCEV